MGVEYTAVLAIGKEFTSEEDAVDFLRERGHLADVKTEQIEDDGLDEHLPYGLVFQNLDLYSDGCYFLGIRLYADSAVTLRNFLDTAIDTWDSHFPGFPADVINTVRYH